MNKELEELRKKFRIRTILFWAILCISFFILLCLNGLFDNSSDIRLVLLDSYIYLLPIFVVELVLFIIKNSKLKNNLEEVYYKEFVEGTYKLYLSDITYEKDSGIDKSLISESSSQKLGNSYKSSHFIRGIYKGHLYNQSDVIIKNYTDDPFGDGSSEHKLFRGQWVVAVSDKNYQNGIYITENNSLFTLLPKTLKEKGYTKVDFTNDEFNKLFTVYACSGADAIYTLSPEKIATLIELHNKINNKFAITLVNNHIHISIKTNKDFIVCNKYFGKIDYEQERKKYKDMLQSIIKIIDMFI